LHRRLFGRAADLVGYPLGMKVHQDFLPLSSPSPPLPPSKSARGNLLRENEKSPTFGVTLCNAGTRRGGVAQSGIGQIAVDIAFPAR
jgi:hypothetical protein